MVYAIIAKCNNKVQSISNESQNYTGIEKFYEIQTEFEFPEIVDSDSYVYDGNTFFSTALSSMQNIDENWQKLYNDYQSARRQIYIEMLQEATELGGFEFLSDFDKKIASKWFIVGRSERDSVDTTDNQVLNGLEYNANSIAARKQRFTKCMMEVYNRLNDDQIKSIMTVMDFSKTTYTYVEAGQEGTLEGYGEGLYDYIMARVGTQWELTGLRAQNYVPVGFNNCEELSDRLMDILVNGNY